MERPALCRVERRPGIKGRVVEKKLRYASHDPPSQLDDDRTGLFEAPGELVEIGDRDEPATQIDDRFAFDALGKIAGHGQGFLAGNFMVIRAYYGGAPDPKNRT